MSIAVIIPVFNAAPYVRQCLQSCIDQKELSEIIVVNDGSTDNSMAIIKEFEEIDARIIVTEHQNAENRGKSASRNLGLAKAKSEWVTFCDADDYYMKNRFAAFLIAKKDEVDGFYEDVKSQYENDVQKDVPEVTGIPGNIPSNQLQKFLIENRNQSISIISLIVRKSVLSENLRFDESLSIGEDTDFIWKLAGTAKLKKLVKERAEIVRRVHGENTYFQADELIHERYLFYSKWHEKINQQNISKLAKKRIDDSYQYYSLKDRWRRGSIISKILATCRYLFYTISSN